MFTVEELIAVVVGRVRGQKYRQVREAFQRRFRKPSPTQQNIQMLVNKFMRTGSVADEQRPGRPPTSQGRVETIRDAIERSPSASTRRLSRELGIPCATVWEVLHFTLKKKASRIQMLHKLEAEDYAARLAICYDLCETAEREHLMDNILFSNETTFHICGMVNRHNCRI